MKNTEGGKKMNRANMNNSNAEDFFENLVCVDFNNRNDDYK
ncbi:MAG TPA: hypothetical protein VI564_07770 [Candidatus Nanoarchaeia archaeon]|nr:hypothetical protein [Candidatus Nanoarchaeia archaeon]